MERIATVRIPRAASLASPVAVGATDVWGGLELLEANASVGTDLVAADVHPRLSTTSRLLRPDLVFLAARRDPRTGAVPLALSGHGARAAAWQPAAPSLAAGRLAEGWLCGPRGRGRTGAFLCVRLAAVLQFTCTNSQQKPVKILTATFNGERENFRFYRSPVRTSTCTQCTQHRKNRVRTFRNLVN